ncbi:unnamed protein product, partial [Chrysoparadoxa australica]
HRRHSTDISVTNNGTPFKGAAGGSGHSRRSGGSMPVRLLRHSSGGDEFAHLGHPEGLAYLKQKKGEEEVIYLRDLDLEAPPGSTTATDVVVQAHRRRVRVKKVIGRKLPNRRRVRPRKNKSGKALDPNDDRDEYMLTMGMMLGLRVAVGRQENPLANKALSIQDFYQVDKYTFPPCGSTGASLVTPSHRLGHTFKFKDYAPKVFKHIRECFGVDRLTYMLSVAGNYNFLEFISNAKSGEFFFFSHDERFMIKTMKPSETKFLRRILPHYYEHVMGHPDSFLVRFYGLYRVKMHHLHRKVHFIVMNSVVDTCKEIHSTYDLKGSTYGRFAKAGEKVKKDQDLEKGDNKLHLGAQRDAFLGVLRKDVQFLARMKIMDYSLLLGIHDRTQPQAEEGSPRRNSRFFNFADEALILSEEAEEDAKQAELEKPQSSARSAWRRKRVPHQPSVSDADGHGEGNGGVLDEIEVGFQAHVDANAMGDTGKKVVGFADEYPDHEVMQASTSAGENGENNDEKTGGAAGEGESDAEEDSDYYVTDMEPAETETPGKLHTQTSSTTLSLGYGEEAETPLSKAILAPTPKGGNLCRRRDQGIDSIVDQQRGDAIYYMGVIDILQEYNARKHGETWFKSFLHKREEISCVDPQSYAD